MPERDEVPNLERPFALTTEIAELVAERARRFGPLPFDEVIELALYHPEHGFYARGEGAGRGADFLTSPEISPLFGAVLARALDEWWDWLGEPDPYVVVEAGAGIGTLARDVLAAEPACGLALRYVLVERSEALRERQRGRVPLEPARQVLGPVLSGPDPDEDPHALRGIGPLATSLSELPRRPFTGVVLANELLDNLPFRLLERGPVWAEVRIGAQLGEVLVPAPPELAQEADRLAPDAMPGGRVPIQDEARAWLRSALSIVERGRVVTVDYVDTTASMARRPWTQWVRTYRRHGPGGAPLDHLGEQDVTCEVAVDQLHSLHPVTTDRSQAEFLRAHGLETLLGAARRAWEESAHVGDLEAMKQRSRLSEADALVDPAGMGAFRVLEWVVP